MRKAQAPAPAHAAAAAVAGLALRLARPPIPTHRPGSRCRAPRAASRARARRPITSRPIRRRTRRRSAAAPTPDETPFDPIGIQVGAFNFKPAIELTGGYDTNPARTQQATPSWYSMVAPELKFNSNWARHEFTGDLRGSYYTYEELPSQNRPNVDSKLTGRIDVTRDTRIDLETKYLIGTDNPGSPNIQAGLAKLPIFQTFGGTVGARPSLQPLRHRGEGRRRAHGLSELALHRRLDREQRRTATTTATTRSCAAATSSRPASSRSSRSAPTAACTISRPTPSASSAIPSAAMARSAPPSSSRASSPARSRVGWLERHYQDPNLPKIAGLTVDGSLTWVASALTTFKLTAVTRADESTVPGVSGQFTREVTLQVDHAFRRWLIATGKIPLRQRRLCRLAIATTTATRPRRRSPTSSPATCG